MALANSFRNSMHKAPKRCASPFLPFPVLFNTRIVSVASSRSPKLTLQDILSQLTPIELDFFIALDAELNKIEKFYEAREAELEARGRALREQLDDHANHKSFLQVRRYIYIVRFPEAIPFRRFILDLERGPPRSFQRYQAGLSTQPSPMHDRDMMASSIGITLNCLWFVLIEQMDKSRHKFIYLTGSDV